MIAKKLHVETERKGESNVQGNRDFIEILVPSATIFGAPDDLNDRPHYHIGEAQRDKKPTEAAVT